MIKMKPTTKQQKNDILPTMIILKYALLLVIAFSTSASWAAEEITYYHHDALGSVIAATDEDGNVKWREDYKPYGERVRKPATDNKLWYTGKPEESALGLQYFGARWYDSALGRFTGIDPVGFQEGNIHSFNRYIYANNNPYMYVDPDGRAGKLASQYMTPGGGGGGGAFGGFSGLRSLKPAGGRGANFGVRTPRSVRTPKSSGSGKLTTNVNKVGRGMQNPKVKSAAARGRAEHKDFATKVKQKPGWQSEKTIIGPNGKKLRPDAMTPSGRPVELKPNTPSGRRQGAKQIQKYMEATGKNGRVIYYKSKR